MRFTDLAIMWIDGIESAKTKKEASVFYKEALNSLANLYEAKLEELDDGTDPRLLDD